MDEVLQPTFAYFSQYPSFSLGMDVKSGDSVYLIVENFKLPFKVSTFLTLASKKNVLLIDKENNLQGKEVYDLMKKQGYTNDLTIIYDILDENKISQILSQRTLDSVVVFATIEKEPYLTGYLKALKLSVPWYVVVLKETKTSGVKPISYGTLTYNTYLDEKQSYSFPYIDYTGSKSLLKTALFSKPSTYGCSISLLTRNLEFSYDFYGTKAKFYSDSIKSSNLLCTLDKNVESEKSSYSALSDIFLKTLLIEVKDKPQFNPETLAPKLQSLSQSSLASADCVLVY
jgi:hypothetical protein